MDSRPVILYVEDDADTFKLTEVRLKSRYRLLWAQNDREACGFLREVGASLLAVLVDVELQGSMLDGFGLVKLLRGHVSSGEALPEFARGIKPLPHVPVIVLTAYVGRYAEDDAARVGASLFLTKPIDFARLSLALAQANIQSVMSLTRRASL
jgi:CheY-like chemotaxis protein